jgi:hypothetical protein
MPPSFLAYLDGLRSENHAFDPNVVRACYLGSLVTRSAMCVLPFELLCAPPSTENEELLLQRLRLTRTMVDMAADV